MTVRVPVSYLLGRRLAQTNHLNIKMQRLAGQRVIEIEERAVVAQLRDVGFHLAASATLYHT